MRMTAILLLAAMLLASAGVSALECPKCRVVSGEKGAPAIHVGRQVFSPIVFAMNNQFGRDEVLIEELKLAADAGIPFFSFNVPLEDKAGASSAQQVVDTFCSVHPEGYFYVRIWVGRDRAWREVHPEACIVRANGEPMDWVSPASDVWLDDTQRLLRERIRSIANGPHGDRFAGACVANMQTGEWFYRHTNDFMDYSKANLRGFRAWLKKRYRIDGALQKAWGDPEVTIETAQFPSPEQRDAASWGPFRDPVRHCAAMDMQRYQSDLIADVIALLAKTIKKATRGRSLAGVFYGYTLELNHNGPRALAHSGHLAFARVLECDDIDLIHAPYSYFERKLGQPGHLHLPVDSIPLHGKLAVLEEDTYTHAAMEPGPNAVAPGWKDRTRDLDQTLAINRRNYGTFLTHRCGMWYFDLLSDGRWRDPELWDSTAMLRRMAAELRDAPVFEPQVAFVVDEASVHALRARTHPYLIESVARWRAEVDRMGAPVGYYLQSDVERLPDSVRLLILANPYRVTKDEREGIERVLERGGTVVWTYAPDIWGPDGADAARIVAACGMAVEPEFGAGSPNVDSIITGETIDLGKVAWTPRFVVTDSDAQPIGVYSDTKDVSIAAKRVGNGLSVYAGVPRLRVGMLRWMAEGAGVHLYRDTPGMTGVVGDYLVVHAESKGTHALGWPRHSRTVERLVPFAGQPVARDASAWQVEMDRGDTAVFRCR
ncbi:MAG: hypothetical protein GY851_17545 [bacterium]|nr:hypothetical protein [bacterium]